MILRSPSSVPPNPLTGPRRIGQAGAENTHYVEFDPANATYPLAGDARDRAHVLIPASAQLGLTGRAEICAIGTWSEALLCRSGDDAGVYSFAIVIPHWLDVSEPIDIKTIVQNRAGQPASGNLVLSAGWSILRSGTTAVDESSAVNIVAGPAAADGMSLLTLGEVPADTLAAGDLVSFWNQRLGSDARDTYGEDAAILAASFLYGLRKGF